MTNIYRRAIDCFGTNAQIRQAQEECAELIVELSHWLRGRSHNVCEEIADVEHVVEQLKLMFNSEELRAAKERKMQRFAERLELVEGQKRDMAKYLQFE